MKILSTIFPSPFEPLRNDAMYWRIWNIRRLLQAEGHDVDLVCYTPKYLYEKIEDRDSLKDTTFKSTALPNLRYLKDLNKYDMIYANTAWSGFHSLLGKLDKHPPIIVDMHGLNSEEYSIQNSQSKIVTPLFFGMRRFMELISVKFSTRVICVSKKMIDYLDANCGVSRNKMDYVGNGVDLNFFKPSNGNKIKQLRDTLKLGDRRVFGYIGGFQKWQGVEEFILAASKFKDKDIDFIILGNSSSYHKDGNIHYLPKVPRLDIPDYYSICDVLVLPRPSHPATEVAAPTKFAEYVSMAKPILTTNVGDAAELVRNYKCGFVVENNNVISLIEGIETFQDMSTQELETMGINSRKLASEEFDWENQRQNLRLCIENIH